MKYILLIVLAFLVLGMNSCENNINTAKIVATHLLEAFFSLLLIGVVLIMMFSGKH